MRNLPDYAQINRTYWDDHADEWVASAERNWADPDPGWGIWGVPETELQMLPTDMTGMDAIELGCGTAYVSSWMARRGATVTGIDNSAAQLRTAHRMQEKHGIEFPLIHAIAESVPFPDASFDFAISEYGAAIWADPYVWIPEAYRLLRPGGQLVFLGGSTLSMICVAIDAPEEETAGLELAQDYFGMHQLKWTQGDASVEFYLPISEWFRLFRETGFEVVDFLEPRPEPGPNDARFFATRSWARRFPSEQVWKLRKPS